MRHPVPPGTTTSVVAERVLVLAPHFDDELLGCGGLLRQLTQAGARTEVLFLTDSGGGVERGEQGRVTDGRDPAGVRRAEAEALAAHAGWGMQCADLPDGRLGAELPALVRVLRERLEGFRPDLVLTPSPWEVTPDHRATFAALFDVLSGIRRDDDLHDVAASLRVLTYEVNHPGHPNLLVDVSGEMAWLTEAVSFYPSQLSLHDYGRAAAGLRSYRTHSLGPEVEAAEAYTELRLDDFRTHSLASLVASLGPPPVSGTASDDLRVSLVVRTFERPRLLREALLSVAAMIRRPDEVIVVNDGGEDPGDALEGLDLPLRLVDLPENRGRSAAANAGVAAATGTHVAFLDDDDLVFPEHLLVLCRAAGAAGVRVAYTDAAVATYRLEAPPDEDGREASGWVCRERRLPYSRDFDPLRLLVDNYIPFHTLLIERRLLEEVGPFDEDLAAFEDWDLLIRLSRVAPFHHVRQATCEYRHFDGASHHALGGRTDSSESFVDAKARVLVKHADLLPADRLAAAVGSLRRETVERELEADELRVRWESDRLERARAETELARSRERLRDEQERYHRTHGEVVALREERQRLQAEEARLREEIHRQGRELQDRWDEETALRAAVDGQTEHLQRTYAEIERLHTLIAEMEGTRAWRLHQLLQRRR